MESKKRKFDKLEVYSEHGTVWLRIFMLGYTIIFIVVILALMLTKLMDNATWEAVVGFFSSGTLSLQVTILGVWLFQMLTALAVSVTLPLLNKSSFTFTMIHLAFLAIGYPLTILITKLATGETPSAYVSQNALPYAIEVIFVILNAVYFMKRQDLFYTSLTKMVTGCEADPNKH